MIKNHIFIELVEVEDMVKGNAINFVLAKDSQYIKDLEKFYNTFIVEMPNIAEIII